MNQPTDELPSLTVENLNAWYADSHVLHGISLRVNPREVVSLLGRNGSGRTTTLKSIMGMVAKRTGSIRLGQDELIKKRSDEIAKMGIAICPEERGIYGTLSVKENLLLPPIVKAGGFDLTQIFSLFPNLEERLGSSGGKLSGGEQQMLAIARILRAGARILLFDEPTEGLAPVIVQQIKLTLEFLKGHGFTIILVEQRIAFAAALADRHYVLENGKLVDEMNAADVASDRTRLTKYLSV